MSRYKWTERHVVVLHLATRVEMSSGVVPCCVVMLSCVTRAQDRTQQLGMQSGRDQGAEPQQASEEGGAEIRANAGVKSQR